MKQKLSTHASAELAASRDDGGDLRALYFPELALAHTVPEEYDALRLLLARCDVEGLQQALDRIPQVLQTLASISHPCGVLFGFRTAASNA